MRDRFAGRFGEGVVAGEAVDLARAAAAIALVAGRRAPDAAIHAVAACTSCEQERFFSYRRDGRRPGRHGGVVWAGGR